MKLIIFALLTVTLVVANGCKKDDRAAKPAAKPVASAVEGAVAPDFTVRDLAGQEVKLAALKGKVVLVNFWATWCPPCREEIPSMMKLNQSMSGKQFQMLALSIDEGGKAAVENFFKKSGMTLPAYPGHGWCGFPQLRHHRCSGNLHCRQGRHYSKEDCRRHGLEFSGCYRLPG